MTTERAGHDDLSPCRAGRTSNSAASAARTPFWKRTPALLLTGHRVCAYRCCVRIVQETTRRSSGVDELLASRVDSHAQAVQEPCLISRYFQLEILLLLHIHVQSLLRMCSLLKLGNKEAVVLLQRINNSLTIHGFFLYRPGSREESMPAGRKPPSSRLQIHTPHENHVA